MNENLKSSWRQHKIHKEFSSHNKPAGSLFILFWRDEKKKNDEQFLWHWRSAVYS